MNISEKRSYLCVNLSESCGGGGGWGGAGGIKIYIS